MHWEALQFYDLFRLRIKRYNQKTYLTDKNEDFAEFGMGCFFFLNSCNFVVFQLFLLFRAPLLGLIFSRLNSSLKQQFEGVHLLDFQFPEVQGLCF